LGEKEGGKKHVGGRLNAGGGIIRTEYTEEKEVERAEQTK